MKFVDIKFLLSVHNLNQLPPPGVPEIAFAGRSNVGKSSLINKLVGRKGLVKVSGRPGKTQGLNFFDLAGSAYFVDLPGYGFAHVSKGMQDGWQSLITSYLETRETLCCVVVIMDIRHGAKVQDSQLISWLKQKGIPCLPVYTKADKLSSNTRDKNALALDAGHTIDRTQRIIFSAKTGQGKEELERALASFTKID
ncbi:MAG: ribosome biogenesis GTP-binding protein YihA/YsxC [Desulfocapsa sp.]|nr:ribosome biogenesis GTP-binding protein YihA/YsxC [Desulfocapsa sp.]